MFIWFAFWSDFKQFKHNINFEIISNLQNVFHSLYCLLTKLYLVLIVALYDAHSLVLRCKLHSFIVIYQVIDVLIADDWIMLFYQYFVFFHDLQASKIVGRILMKIVYLAQKVDKSTTIVTSFYSFLNQMLVGTIPIPNL